MSEVVVVEWSTITVDVKKLIVEYLDYESRCNLRTCSKSDLALVDSVKFVPAVVSIEELVSELDELKTIVRLQLDTFTIWFIGKNDVTKVDRAWSNGEVIEWGGRREENRYEVARRCIDRHFPGGLIVAREIQISALIMGPSEHWRLKCDRLELKLMRNDRHLPWLSQSVHDFKRLTISPFSGNALSISPSLLNASELLRFNWDTDMTDEHLELVRAPSLRVSSPHISPGGVRNFMEKFLKYGKAENTFEFRISLPADFDYSRLFAETLLIKRTAKLNGNLAFEARILGGFSNVHGVQDARKLYAAKNGTQTSIWCHIPSKFRMPCQLWPFTDN